jgi:ABC-2 type transport system permease protein
MKNIWAILKRELQSYFTSPVAYVVITIFLVIAGYFFYVMLMGFMNYAMQVTMQASYYQQAAPKMSINDFVIRPFFGNVAVISLFVVPMITMRLLAEEKKNGTFELLFTSPIHSWHIVLGKFLAGFVLYLVMVLPTFVYSLIVMIYGNPAITPIFTGYLGLILMGGAFIALGLWISANTENQIIAAAASFGLFLLIWVISWMGESAGSSWQKVIEYLSVLQHMENFSKGVLDTQDFVYYFSVIGTGLFLAFRSVESVKWK